MRGYDLEKAATAVLEPVDPPESAKWIAAFATPQLPNNVRNEIMSAPHGMFGPKVPFAGIGS